MLLLERNYVTGGLEPQIKKKDYELNGLYLYDNDGHQKFVTLIIKCRQESRDLKPQYTLFYKNDIFYKNMKAEIYGISRIIEE